MALILAALLVTSCATRERTPPVATPRATVPPSPVAAIAEPTAAGRRVTPESTHEPPASPTPADRRQLLISAVDNLQQAAGFSLTANEVRAYRAIEPDGETRLVYGEFTTRYDVIRRPALKIRAGHEYRYDPQAAFAAVEAYTYQRNGRYYSRLVEASGAGAEGETSLERIEPLAGDLPDTAHLL